MDRTALLAQVLERAVWERGYTLDQLQAATGVPKQTLSRWLRGEVRHPHPRIRLLKVAAALRLTRARANLLLQAAGLPAVDVLLEEADDTEERAVLTAWDGRAPTNLPSPLSRFVGREEETLDIAETLSARHVRLVTLTGAGGSGKTRLAIEVGRALLDVFSDGVYFVGLAALADPDLVLPAISRVLGLPEAAGAPLDRLTAHMRECRVLLVLDNFEQVVAAGPLLTALLTAAPVAKALVTSRAPLHVTGEHERPVRPLPLPTAGDALRALHRSPAVALFVERARAVNPAFALTRSNAPAVVELCARLDGLPLAIELAAARVRTASPQELLARFPDRLALAAAGPRDAPARQQTLRATIAWSYDLLDGDAKALFARLAVFAGGASFAAVAAIGGSVRGRVIDVAREMAALVGSSLASQTLDERGLARIEMLETIREYAEESLLASDDAETVRKRHAAYYLALAEEITQPRLLEPDHLDRLEREHANFRVALTHLRAGGDAKAALRLAAALWPFWNARGYMAEGREWLKWALAATPDGAAPLRTAALRGLAALILAHGDYPGAVAHFERALGAARKLGSERDIASILNQMGNALHLEGDYVRAEACCCEALALQRALGDAIGVAQSLHHLGNIAYARGEYEQGAAFYEEALALKRANGHGVDTSITLNWLGRLRFAQGDYPAAVRLHHEALNLVRSANDAWGIASSLANLGRSLVHQGEAAERQGRRCLTEALPHLLKIGDRRGIAVVLEDCATLAAAQQSFVCAVRLLSAAATQRRVAGAVPATADRSTVDRVQAALRAALSPETFATAWEEGQGRSLDLAVTDALVLLSTPRQ